MAAETGTAQGPYAAAWQEYRGHERFVLVLGIAAGLGWLLLPMLAILIVGQSTPGELLVAGIAFVLVIALQAAFFLVAWQIRRWRCPQCGAIWGDWVFSRVYACPSCKLAKYAEWPGKPLSQGEGS